MTAIAVLVALVLLLAVLLLVHAAPARRSAPYLPREGLSSARVEWLWWPEPAAPVPRAEGRGGNTTLSATPTDETAPPNQRGRRHARTRPNLAFPRGSCTVRVHSGHMRTRADVEQELLDVMQEIHRCDRHKDDVGAELARIQLEVLQAEWPTIPEQRTDPEARFAHERPFHTG